MTITRFWAGLTAASILALFLALALGAPTLSWSEGGGHYAPKKRIPQASSSQGPASVAPMLNQARWPKSIPMPSGFRQTVSKTYRAFFDILESGNDISKVLDRTRWPDHDLLASYLELELLFHPRYRMTTERLRLFLEKWPRHVQADRVRKHLEGRITRNATDTVALAWYDKNMPKSRRARMRHLRLLLEKKWYKNARFLWKALYKEGALFPKDVQKRARAFEKKSTLPERETRARRLLKAGSYSEFRRLLKQLPAARQAYFRALEAAFRGKKTFHALLKKLSSKAASNTELWDERARGLRRAGKRKQVVKFVLGRYSANMSAKGRHLIRYYVGRDFYIKNDWVSAMTLLRANVREAGGKLPDSLWLAAWSAYRHKDYKKARAWFIQLATEGPKGEHRAKGAFWASRLSRSKKEKSRWLAVASQYPGSFYGLLAIEHRLGTLKPFPEPDITCPTTWKGQLGEDLRDLQLLKAAGRGYYVGPEIRKLADQYRLTLTDQLCLARVFGTADRAVKVANQLKNRGQTFWSALYPVPEWTPLRGWKLDPALVWAATRQESLFFHRAVSSAKASGLMQLMPATARQEAKRTGMPPSSPYRLQLPFYNLELGQSYLAHMLKHFDGDLLLSVASYNAGPSRGDAWQRFRKKGDPLTFIENIPFTETRNYVKRVAHGLAMYRLQLYGAASLKALLKKGKQNFFCGITERWRERGVSGRGGEENSRTQTPCLL